MLIDVWSMARIAYFSMGNSIACLKSVGNNELWAIDLNGSLRVFYIPIMENYFFEANCVPEISNTALITYNIKDDVINIAVSRCNQIIIAQLKHGLRIYLKN